MVTLGERAIGSLVRGGKIPTADAAQASRRELLTRLVGEVPDEIWDRFMYLYPKFPDDEIAEGERDVDALNLKLFNLGLRRSR